VTVRVLLVDDEALVRAGLAVILQAEPGIEVVGEAEDGAQALALAGRLRPDVVVMDIRMPRMDGIRATGLILERVLPPPAVLVLTTFENDGYVAEALRAGACGFLAKRTRPEQIRHAVHVVAGGETVLFPAQLGRLVAGRSRRARDDRRLAALTERETEVLRLIAAGMSNAEIGDRLHVGVQTVKTHVGAVLAKLGVRDRTQAAIAAYTTGLVRPVDGDDPV
jgi:DNA-binding NarL/FixJ family response regulator